MSVGSRLFRALRANVGHAVRRLGRDRLEADPELELPELDAEGPSAEERAHYQRQRQRAAAARSRRDELEKAYRALELDWGADAAAIKQAHRRLLRQFHPDRFANDPERLEDATRLSQELTIARDTLLDAIEKGVISPS
ncbi:MAG: J domain-containing protein [Deltaproteobacteria bacterium]|nr:J domain-containing protein [Deltaproteobacteria bacterium]